ncbi:hypothetical protein [Halobacillus hunanensis]|uniref:hypothetical protein n=1 Tax=Halobacillus hunanensis TaxID=578214 RepID=UPI0009A86191|nr:hypothetical protein [Halobacillus hunanensis]
MSVHPKFQHRIMILDLNDDLSDEEIEDVVDEIGEGAEPDDLNISVMKSEYITKEQDRVLKEKIMPNQYPYFLIIRGEIEEIDRIKSEYKKKHRIRNFFKMIHPDELFYSTQDYMLDFDRTVFHADNTNDIIEYLIEYSDD